METELRDEVNQVGDDNRAKFQSTGWWHSIDLGNGQITPGVRGLEELQRVYASFGLPEDLRERRVLDIGCWDGFFSFEAERRGAEVVAVDCWRPETFFEARRILNSRVEFHEMSVYDITRDGLGAFDIVFFLGVIYHLQHPLLALQRVCEVSRDTALIESHVIDNVIETPYPVMEFYENDELSGQYDNWWGPNTDCLARMTRTAGFVRASVISREPARAAIKAFRRFNDLPTESAPSIELLAAVHAFTFQKTIPRRGRHAFVTLLVNGLPVGATRDDVRVVVGEYGALPSFVGPVANPDEIKCEFQINAPMPPGLAIGPASVRVFCRGRGSNPVTIDATEGSMW